VSSALLTVEQAKRELLRRITKNRARSVATTVSLGCTPPHVIDQALTELRDEGRIFVVRGRWYERGPAPRWGAETREPSPRSTSTSGARTRRFQASNAGTPRATRGSTPGRTPSSRTRRAGRGGGCGTCTRATSTTARREPSSRSARSAGFSSTRRVLCCGPSSGCRVQVNGTPGGGFTVALDQVDWGHVARKSTLLYVVGIEWARVFAGVLRHRGSGTPTHWISGFRSTTRPRSYDRNGSAVPPGIKVCSAQQRRRSPRAFAEWLVDLARYAQPSATRAA
jgi:hypothetical protein